MPKVVDLKNRKYAYTNAFYKYNPKSIIFTQLLSITVLHYTEFLHT